MEHLRVPVSSLRWSCDETELCFECTDGLPLLEEFIGQDRALKAIEFGLSVHRPGYNIFVTGLTGTGKMSAIKSYLQKLVDTEREEIKPAQPEDWCYVYNIGDPDRPQILNLPKGTGKVLRTRMEELFTKLKAEIGKAFASEQYDINKKQLLEQGQRTQRQMFQKLEKEAAEEGFALQISQMGVALIPMVDGKPATQESYLALPEAHRSEIDNRRSQFMDKVGEAFQYWHSLQRELEEKIRTLDQQVVEFAISRPFSALRTEFKDFSSVTAYLDAARAYTLENVDRFRPAEEQAQQSPLSLGAGAQKDKDSFLAFQVNVFVDNSATEGPPIIIETNPNHGNLFGKIERRSFMGAYFTDHTMLKPGSMALANGGYLVLNARDALLSPGVWETLKRVIRNKNLRLEDPLEQLGYIAPQGLRPEGMPIDVKVIMVGDHNIYHLLSANDEDFWEIFKVKADFDHQIDRTPENVRAYASFVGTRCLGDDLRHFHRSGVAKVIEHCARLVEDQTKLSSRFGQIKDLLIEADYWARDDKSELISAEHVRKAIEERVYRSNLIQERLQAMIAEGTLMVDVKDAIVGQVNGLAVYDLGDIAFGKPSRITARTYVGRSGVVNIEREAQLSGKTHDKGVLILTGFLGSRFAQNKPLSLSASLCFEQSYSGVDGDSASSTELYAILSSLSGLPIKQSIAVTGSVNQRGEIQPIGGVNQKIEGFFDICKAKGLTGEQGVIIPHQNVKNLMLREDVIAAVAGGRFHIYAAKTIDEGVEILTGIPAGERKVDGTYPDGTVNSLVDKALHELALGLKAFQEEEKK
ncbi:MAG: AAA family ATPase [Chloroflexi bacterium]|nr:AAA family ATPase [Chloroflexota bacterium]